VVDVKARNKQEVSRQRRHARVRKKVTGTPERPRLGVFRSNKHMYAQIIDDVNGTVLAAASTRSKEVRESVKAGGTIAAAKAVGAAIAAKAAAKSVTRVVFDRGGYLYHGRVKALADAAREKGLQF
jgi:large subunit ribosomal protein L18